MEKSRKSDRNDSKLPAAGPHDKSEQADPEKTPGSGTLPKPGSSDPNDMAPTG